MRRPLAVALVALCLGCRSAEPARPAAPTPPPASFPSALHWVRNSAEYRAIALQSYRLAGEEIEKAARGREAGSWAVILDADETVLDNSGYEKELFEQGAKHTPERWAEWVRRKSAPAVPGAPAFLRRVRGLGGRIAFVSNRTEAECPDTAATLEARGMAGDAVLCRPPDQRDKRARFEKVASGEAFPDGKPVEVLMWVGDNINDFPGMSQASRKGPDDAFAAFGTRYFALPNPVYGSWEENARE